jgi:hypothetical protein
VLRPKRDHRVELHRLTRIELEPLLANDHREDDLRFHHRKVVPDAHPLAASEREIRPARA